MTDSDCKQGEDTKALTSTIWYPANLPQDPFPSNMYTSSAHKNPPFKCYSLYQEGKQTPPHRPITHSSAAGLLSAFLILKAYFSPQTSSAPSLLPPSVPSVHPPTRPLLTPGLQVGRISLLRPWLFCVRTGRLCWRKPCLGGRWTPATLQTHGLCSYLAFATAANSSQILLSTHKASPPDFDHRSLPPLRENIKEPNTLVSLTSK